MIHGPLWAALRSLISPPGVSVRYAQFLQGSKMWLCVQSPSWQGGLTALRCILPYGAHGVLFSGGCRMNRLCPSLQGVTHA
jgi:hypothetical protein